MTANKYLLAYILFYASCIASLNIIAPKYFQLFYFMNPIMRFVSGTYDLSSIYDLSAGRLASNGNESIVQFNFSQISLLGNGYHSYTIDNGYLYLLEHIGIFGLFLVLLLFFSVFIFPHINQKFAQTLRPFRHISIFYFVFLAFALLAGSILTIPKASSFIFLCIIFIYHVFTSLLISL